MSGQEARSAATSFRDVFVREGSNDYEWHVYHVLGTKLATLPSQKEAAAFMDGYAMGQEQVERLKNQLGYPRFVR